MNAQSGMLVKDGEPRAGSLVLFKMRTTLTSWSFFYCLGELITDKIMATIGLNFVIIIICFFQNT